MVDVKWLEAHLKGERSKQELAAKLGRKPQAVSNILAGTRRIQTGEDQIIADYLGESVLEVRRRLGKPIKHRHPQVPVVGYVGAGQQWFPIDDHMRGAGLDEAPWPAHLDQESVVAVMVRGESMHPMGERWVLFYRREQDGVPTDCIGKLVVAEVAGNRGYPGPTYVKILRRGTKKGRWRLESWNAPTIEDVALNWAARVLAIIPA